MQAVQEQEFVLSGGFGRCHNSAREGYLPVALRHLPSAAFHGLQIFRRRAADEAHGADGFLLYRDRDQLFTTEDRQRLLNAGTRFVYIRIADQSRFLAQAEAAMADTAGDSTRAVSEKAAVVYETSLELVNELLAEPDLAATSTRLEQFSRAVVTLALSDGRAFSHLFAASHHDFYTATHMVNVATWIVPVAYALGHRDQEELARICLAGLLHDIGKVFIPERILNKQGPLNAEEWRVLREHPRVGSAYLQSFVRIPPLVLTVVRQHHERLDGSGYPEGLTGDQIHPVSRICALVDSFDAMTAFRPFKSRTMTVVEAIRTLQAETPQKYDPNVLETWLTLLQRVHDDGAFFNQPAVSPVASQPGAERRRWPRSGCYCPGRVHALRRVPEGQHEQPGIQVTVHNLSDHGLGFLSPESLPAGQTVRVYLLGGELAGMIVHGQVVRCREYRDGWFEIGVAFMPSETN